MASVVLKLVVGGEGGVGKTTILQRFLTHEFVKGTTMTIGVQFHIQELERNGISFKLAMWDLGGQDRFRFVLSDYCVGSIGAFLVFDMSDLSTLESMDTWVGTFRKRVPDLPILLIGTKCDKVSPEDRNIIEEIARKEAEKRGFIGYFSTSSKTGENVDRAIYFMVDHAFLVLTTVGYPENVP